MKLFEGGLNGAVKWVITAVAFYFAVVFFVPHAWFFEYESITPAQAVVGKELKYTSSVKKASVGQYEFSDVLDCVIDGQYERIAETPKTRRNRTKAARDFSVTWTWRENEPFIVPEGTTECILQSQVTYFLLGVFPISWNNELAHEIQLN